VETACGVRLPSAERALELLYPGEFDGSWFEYGEGALYDLAEWTGGTLDYTRPVPVREPGVDPGCDT
jgi:hypothetical protein